MSTAAAWALVHSDAWHPGSRDDCAHCQAMSAVRGPMAPVEEIIEAARVSAPREERIPPRLRWEVWERDDFRCRGCGVRRYLTVDHIIPRVRGGPTTPDNLQTLCSSCNSSKGTK